MRFLKSKEEKELERRIQARQGRTRILRHIEKQRQAVAKYWELGKRALQMEDDRQFRIIGSQYLWTQQEISRWERYVLMLDTIEARRDQAVSVTEFIGSIKALSESMMAQADPRQMARLQQDLEMGLARASTLQERMELLMEMTDSALLQAESDFSWERDDRMEGLKEAMAGDVGDDDLDARISEGLKKLEQEMRRENR
jgi:hypothetical protein